MQCSKCGNLALFKQGIKKETGKPWSGYFCQKQDCKNVDWQPKAPPKSNQVKESGPSDGFGIIGETLARLELKIDFLIDFVKPTTSIAREEKEESGGMESIKEILKAGEENEIKVSDIPF